MEPQESEVNTGGGASIDGNVSVDGSFIGRDQIHLHNYFTGWPIVIALLLLVLISLAIYSISPTTQDPTPSPYFSYKILVQDEASRPLDEAKVTLHIGGDLVLPIERTDATGLAVFSIPIGQKDGAARLHVERVNYKAYTQEISLLEGTLPNRILMEFAE